MSTPVKCWRWLTARHTTQIIWAARRQEAIRNRTITDVFEPGSTVKPMSSDDRVATWRGAGKTQYSIPFAYRINGHEIKDVARYNELTLTGVLQKSSNVGVPNWR